MENSKKSFPDMLGWQPELHSGQPMADPAPGEVKLKIVITAKGVSIFALSEHPETSNQLLEETGFEKNRIRGMLCG
jgi:hypothetical protein